MTVSTSAPMSLLGVMEPRFDELSANGGKRNERSNRAYWPSASISGASMPRSAMCCSQSVSPQVYSIT